MPKMFMSLFFLLLTVFTYSVSHWWALRSRPQAPVSFEWTKKFNGSLDEFTAKLLSSIKLNPHWLLLEKTKTRFIISESPGLFQFGCFYHIDCKETPEGLEVKVTTQSKLVGINTEHSKLNKRLFKKMGFKDVG